MCGLVGVAGAITYACDKAYKDLLIIDSLRGSHSTGSLFVHATKGTSVVKVGGDPFEIMNNKLFERGVGKLNNVMMGHNRYATKGAVNKTNAHPFEFDNIIGAHNGTLTTQYKLDDYTDFDVDSENLYYHMDKHGVEETTDKLGGAYALTWYNKAEGTLNFLRNTQRPLHYTFTKDGKTVFWASEEWMLEGILERNGIVHGAIQEFKEFVHYKMPIQFGTSTVVDELGDFITKEVPKYVPPSAKNTRNLALVNKDEVIFDKVKKFLGKEVTFYVLGIAGGRSSSPYISARLSSDITVPLRIYAKQYSDLWYELLEYAGSFLGTIKKVTNKEGAYGLVDLRTITEIETVAIDDDSEVKDEPIYRFAGYRGSILTSTEWKNATRNGCAWCSNPPLEHEQGELVWLSDNEFVCADCAQEDEVKQHLI